jgi:hypothetical protein
MEPAVRDKLMEIIEECGKRSANNDTAVSAAMSKLKEDADLHRLTLDYIWERGMASIMNDWRHHEREKAWVSIDNMKSAHKILYKRPFPKAPRVSVEVMKTLSNQVTFNILTDWTVGGKRLGDLEEKELMTAAESEKKNAAGSATNARFFKAIAKKLDGKKVKQVWEEVQLHIELDKARKAEEDFIKVI